ncbi:hypothetical protein CDIK_0030 [Cucumispora dikerogammari]|nr:hypothetical protein CDIK_0030 [Cucumispora dikerogammari]
MIKHNEIKSTISLDALLETVKLALCDIKDFDTCIKEILKINHEKFVIIQIVYILSVECFNKQNFLQSTMFINTGLFLFKEIAKDEFISPKDQYTLQSLFYDFMTCRLEIVTQKSLSVTEIITFIQSCLQENTACFGEYKTQSIFNIQFLIYCYHKIENENQVRAQTFILLECINIAENKEHFDLFADLLLKNKKNLSFSDKEIKAKIIQLNPLFLLFLNEERLENQHESILNYFLTTNNLQKDLQDLLSLSIKFSIICKQNYDEIYLKILNNLLDIKTVFGNFEISLIEKYKQVAFRHKLVNSKEIKKSEVLELIDMNEMVSFIIETKNFGILANILDFYSGLKNNGCYIYSNSIKNNESLTDERDCKTNDLKWHMMFQMLVYTKKYKEAKKLLENEKISPLSLIKTRGENNIKYEVLLEYFLAMNNIEITKIIISDIKEPKDFYSCFKVAIEFENSEISICLIEKGLTEKSDFLWILHCLKFLETNMKNNVNLIYNILCKVSPLKINNRFLYNFVYNFVIEIIETNSELEKTFLKSAIQIALEHLSIKKDVHFIEISLNAYNCLLENNINIYTKDIYNLWDIYNMLESKRLEQKKKDVCLLIFFIFFTKDGFPKDAFKCLENISKTKENYIQLCEIEIFYGCKFSKNIYKIFEECINLEIINQVYLESCLYLFIAIGPAALIDFLEFLQVNVQKNKLLKIKDFFNEQIVFLLEKQKDFLILSKNQILVNRLEKVTCEIL